MSPIAIESYSVVGAGFKSTFIDLKKTPPLRENAGDFIASEIRSQQCSGRNNQCKLEMNGRSKGSGMNIYIEL